MFRPAKRLSVAAAFSFFGTLFFETVLLPPIVACTATRWSLDLRLRRLAWASAAGSGCILIARLGLEAAYLANSRSIPQAFAVWPKVILATVFGHVLGLQLLVLAAAGLALVRARRVWRLAIATGLAAVLTALEAGHGHAFAMYPGPSSLLASEALHLLAGGIWLGELIPLVLVLRTGPLDIAGAASTRFSPIGISQIRGLEPERCNKHTAACGSASPSEAPQPQVK